MDKKLILGITLSSIIIFSGCDSSSDSKNNDELKTASISSRYLTNSNDYTLYTFDNDEINISNCNGTQVGECAEIWPPYYDSSLTSLDITNSLSTIKRDDNTSQTTYMNKPLYTFKKDGAVGDINGDFVKGKWHLIYPSSDFNTTQTDPAVKLSSKTNTQKYIVDKNGVALYTFDNDTVTNASTCYNDCEKIWPVFNADLKTIKLSNDLNMSLLNNVERTDGKKQISYNGKPLYYFAQDDNKSGSIKGNWKKGIWHLVNVQ